MPRRPYLYKNRVFSNKVKQSIIFGRKEKALGTKKKVLLPIKSLIYARGKRCLLLGRVMKD